MKSRDETAKGDHISSELLDILDVSRRLHIQNSLYLYQIGAYAIVADDIVGLGRIPDGTLKIHFFGLSFHWYLLRAVKVCWRLSTRV
jgi:hypothetical protein